MTAPPPDPQDPLYHTKTIAQNAMYQQQHNFQSSDKHQTAATNPFSLSEQIAAVHTELAATTQAIRETQHKNQHLTTRIQSLHQEKDAMEATVENELKKIEAFKTKMNIMNYMVDQREQQEGDIPRGMQSRKEAKDEENGRKLRKKKEDERVPQRAASARTTHKKNVKISSQLPENKRGGRKAQHSVAQDWRTQVFEAKLKARGPNALVPLPDLENTAIEAKTVLQVTQEENETARLALRKLLEYRCRLESDLGRQVAKNAGLNEDVSKAKKMIQKKCGESRQLNRDVTILERNLAELKSKISSLTSEAKSIDKFSERLQKKLNEYDKEIHELQGTRLKSKSLVMDEVEVTRERDAMIDELKAENAFLVDELMKESEERAIEWQAHRQVDVDIEKEREEALYKLYARQKEVEIPKSPVRVRAAPKGKETLRSEANLLDELNSLVKKTRESITESEFRYQEKRLW